jgi:hypothetical protein
VSKPPRRRDTVASAPDLKLELAPTNTSEEGAIHTIKRRIGTPPRNYPLSTTLTLPTSLQLDIRTTRFIHALQLASELPVDAGAYRSLYFLREYFFQGIDDHFMEQRRHCGPLSPLPPGREHGARSAKCGETWFRVAGLAACRVVAGGCVRRRENERSLPKLWSGYELGPWMRTELRATVDETCREIEGVGAFRWVDCSAPATAFPASTSLHHITRMIFIKPYGSDFDHVTRPKYPSFDVCTSTNTYTLEYALLKKDLKHYSRMIATSLLRELSISN